jgi:[acyl-carrier-protein] S-malonyltransferase
MKALLFPGQGSQIVGMGQEFYNNFDIVKKLFNEADEKLKFKISKLILEGPSSDLKLTKNTQPAILTVSYSIYSVLIKEFNFDLKDIKYFAGHSLGEYSALLCAGSLSFSDSLFLLHERGKAMQAAVPIGEGGMLAILGLSIIEIENYISQIKNSGVCELANDNSEGQIIVSGNIKLINELNENLKKDKKKSIILPVSAPFHCSLMKKAAD